MNDITFYHQVLIEKIRPKSIIGQDAAYFSSGKKYIVGFFNFKKSMHVCLIAQIQLVRSFINEVGESFFLQFSFDGRTHHSPMTGYINFILLLHSFLLAVGGWRLAVGGWRLAVGG